MSYKQQGMSLGTVLIIMGAISLLIAALFQSVVFEDKRFQVLWQQYQLNQSLSALSRDAYTQLQRQCAGKSAEMCWAVNTIPVKKNYGYELYSIDGEWHITPYSQRTDIASILVFKLSAQATLAQQTATRTDYVRWVCAPVCVRGVMMASY